MFDRQLILNRVMLSAWFANGLMMMGFVVIMPFIPLYVQELGVTDPSATVFWSGAIFAAFGVAAFFTGPLMGSLADRIGPKPVILWGFAVASLAFLLMGAASNLYLLVLLRFLQGLFGAGAPAATSSMVANSAPKPKMGQAFGFYQTSMTVASGVGPLVGGIVADVVGLREAFFVSSGLMVVGFLAALLFIPGVRFPSHGPRPGPIKELRQIAGSRALLTVWVALVMLQVSMFFIIPIYPLFLQELGVAQVASTMGVLMAVNAMASTFATPVSGLLADRRGHRRVLIGSLGCNGLAIGATAVVSSLTQLVGLQVVGSILGSGIGPTTSSLAAEASPKHQRGGAFGMLSTARTMGVMLGPLVGGVVVQLAGLRGAFVATGLLTLLVALWIATMARPTRFAEPTPAEPSGPAAGRESGADAPHSKSVAP
ncbi:MAG: MFS transporter [Chloroflexota bacterium]